MKTSFKYFFLISSIMPSTGKKIEPTTAIDLLSNLKDCAKRIAELNQKQTDWRTQVTHIFDNYEKTHVYEPNLKKIIDILRLVYHDDTALAINKLRQLRSLNDSLIEEIPFIGNFTPFDNEELGEKFAFRMDDVIGGKNYSLALEIKQLQAAINGSFHSFQKKPHRHLALDPAFIEFRFVVSDRLDNLADEVAYLMLGNGEMDKNSLDYLRSLCGGAEGILNLARYMHNRITQDCEDVPAPAPTVTLKVARSLRQSDPGDSSSQNQTSSRQRRGISDDSPTTCLTDAILKVSRFDYPILERLIGLIAGDLGRLRLIAPICTWVIGGQNRDLSVHLNRQIFDLYQSTLDYLIKDFTIRKRRSEDSEDYQVKKLLESAGAEKQAQADLTWRAGENIFNDKIKKLQVEAQTLVDKIGRREVKKQVLMMANNFVIEDEDILKLRIMRTTTHNMGSLDSSVDASYFRAVILRRPRGKEFEDAEAKIREIYAKNKNVLFDYIDSVKLMPPEQLNEGIAGRMEEIFGPKVSIITHFYHKGMDFRGHYLTHPRGDNSQGPLRIEHNFQSTPCEFSLEAIRNLYDMVVGLGIALAKSFSYLGPSPGHILGYLFHVIKEKASEIIMAEIKNFYPFGQNVIEFGPVDRFAMSIRQILKNPTGEIAKLIGTAFDQLGEMHRTVLDMLVSSIQAFFNTFISTVKTESDTIVANTEILKDETIEKLNETFEEHNITIAQDLEIEFLQFQEMHGKDMQRLMDNQDGLWKTIIDAFADGLQNFIRDSFVPKDVTTWGESMIQEMLRDLFGKCGSTAITVWISPKME